MKTYTFNLLKKTFMPYALAPAALETVTVLCRGVLWSYLSKEMLEALLGGKTGRLLVTALLLFADLSLGTLAKAASKLARVHLSCRATMKMEDAVLEKFVRMEKRRTYTDETMLGYLSDTASKASGEMLDYMLNLFQNVLSIVTTSIYAWMLSPYILLVILLVAIAAVLFMRKDTNKLPQLYESFFEHQRVLNAKLWEQVKNHEAAGMLNLKRVTKGYKDRNAKFLRDLVKIKKIDNKVFFAKRYGPLFMMVLTVFCGGILSRKGVLGISEIYAVVVMLPGLAGALLALPSMVAEKSAYFTAHQILNEFFGAQETPAGTNPVPSIKSVELRQVSYRYAKAREPAIRKLTLSFRPGMNCLAGPSGGGKSTVLLLLLRILHPQSGMVSVNGQNVMAFDRAEFYSHISYVGQRPAVFPETVRWNILQDSPQDDQRFEQVLKEVQLTERLAQMEKGAETVIDPGKLSSGEKQKIALARALYSRAELIVLDEATSQMDPASEQSVLEALRLRAQDEGCIILYTAHREAFIKEADRVFRIENGTLAKEGSADETHGELPEGSV